MFEKTLLNKDSTGIIVKRSMLLCGSIAHSGRDAAAVEQNSERKRQTTCSLIRMYVLELVCASAPQFTALCRLI